MVPFFDAWPNVVDVAGGTSNSHIDPRQSGTFQADFTSREPVQSFSNYGTGVNVQARVDANINSLADNGVDAMAPLIILPAEIYGATVDADPIRQDFSIPFNAYLVSSVKSRLKFIPNLQAISIRYPYPGFPSAPANATDGGTYITQWGAYIAGLLNDSQCLTIGGVKAVGMYGTPSWPSAMHSALISAVTAAGGPPFVLIDWSHSPSDATRLGAVATVNYPPNPAFPVGNGQHAYSELVTINVALATPAGTGFSAVISGHLDQRPLSHSGSDGVTPWVDQPSQLELFQHAYSQMRRVVSAIHPTLVSLHSWNEYAEDGNGYEPTKQEGSRKLQAIRWAKDPTTRPTRFTYSLSAENSLVVKTGTWTMTRSLGTPVFDNRILSSSTPGDTASFSHIAALGYAIYGETGPGLGTFNVQVDGGAATLVSAVGSAAHHQLLWSSGALTQGTHTVLITVVSGTVSLDAIQITCNPSSFPLP